MRQPLHPRMRLNLNVSYSCYHIREILLSGSSNVNPILMVAAVALRRHPIHKEEEEEEEEYCLGR